MPGTLNRTATLESEWQLIEQTIAGNSEAFEKIYRFYWHKIYRLCLSILKNSSQAEEVTQDVFMQLFRKISTFKGESKFSAWLYRIAVNRVYEYFRKQKYQVNLTPNEIETEDGQQLSAEISEQPMIVSHIALQEAIDSLPPKTKRVFLLHDVEGYQHDEISRMLNIDTGTSKSQLHKARLKLRKFLNGNLTEISNN